MDLELKKIQNEAQQRIQIFEEDLKVREAKIKEKEAIWMVIERLMK